VLFLHWKAHPYYDFGTSDDQEWLVDEIIAHKWDKNRLSFQIRWNFRDITWEPYQACKNLQVLDTYLEIMGTEDPCNLLC
jgi:hypothetical protein